MRLRGEVSSEMLRQVIYTCGLRISTTFDGEGWTISLTYRPQASIAALRSWM